MAFGTLEFGIRMFGLVYLTTSFDRTGNMYLIQARMNPSYGEIEVLKPIGEIEMRKNEWLSLR